MTRNLLIFLCVVISCLADPECGHNEVIDNCPVDCAADYCPRSEEEAQQSCPPRPDPCPEPTCKCRINYRYVSSENKTCIPTRQCPPFECNRINEEYNPCPPLCPNGSCAQATPDGTCPKYFGHIGILLICSPKCRCIKDYWKQDGVCIPYAECPKNLTPSSETSIEKPVPEPSASACSAPDPQPDTQAEDPTATA